jgi:hypothetical protein
MQYRSDGRSVGQLSRRVHRSRYSRFGVGYALVLSALLIVVAASFCAESPAQVRFVSLFVENKETPAPVQFQSGFCATTDNTLDAPFSIRRERVDSGISSIVPLGEYTQLAWERYKWRIGLFGVLVIVAVLIASLIRSATAQRRNLKQLAYDRKLETLVAQLAAAFINLSSELVNAEIERSFQRLLEFLDLDQINLFEVSPRTAQLRLLHSRGFMDAAEPPAIIDLHQLPWTASQILRGTPIVAARLDEFPEKARGLREILGARGVRSFIAFPLQQDESTFATLSFSTIRNEREWSPDLVRALRTIADIFGNALKRKYAEEALQQSGARLTGIIESAMDAIIAVDDQQNIVVFNAAAEKIFGCSTTAALGQSLRRFVPPHLRADYDAHISQLAETGIKNCAMSISRALRANGEEFPIDASISQVEMDGTKLFTLIIRDITEREQSERALRASEQLQASILASLRSQVVVLDHQGIVLATNKNGADVAPRNCFFWKKQCKATAEDKCDLLEISQNANYFEMWRRRQQTDDPVAAAALGGIRAVCERERDHFELEYYCGPKSDTDQCWLLMSVTPLKGGAPGAVVSHQDITEQMRHEQAIRELGGRLIKAQEQERSRIARELHDDINQQVAVLAIELQQLERFIPEDSTEGHQKAQVLWKKIHGVSTEIHHISHQLHSAKLEHLGLIAALRGLCNEFSAQYKIRADFQAWQVPPALGSDSSLGLFRVAQESLHNVAKHSRAKNVRVDIVGRDDQVLLRVWDDGVGFDSERTTHQTGLGMVSMSERIRLVGGTLSVSSKPSMGTQVEAAIPLSRKDAGRNDISKSA